MPGLGEGKHKETHKVQSRFYISVAFSKRKEYGENGDFQIDKDLA